MTMARRALHRMVKTAASTYDRIRPPEPGTVVLAYHRVGGGSGLEVDLDPADFADQMAWLAAEANPIPIADAVDELGATTPARSGSVVVTFDDGTADFVEHALPALVDHGVPATYYIATEFIDDQRPFPDDGTPMTWGGLAEAVATGLVTVGSHTHSHAVLDKLSPDQADEELRRAAELIEDHLGVTADHFAYPKGVFGGEANEAVVSRYHRSAALANCGVNVAGATDPLRLDRTPIQRSDGAAFFRRKAVGGLRLEGQLRAGLNRRRYDSAVS